MTNIVARTYGTQEILAYTQSDSAGGYQLQVRRGAPSIISIEYTYLGYTPQRREIVLGKGTSIDDVHLPTVVMQPSENSLKEITVKAQSPVVVNGDTIRYDLPHWTEARHETLEAVLSQLPGMRINERGELVVNGQLVDKVTINGKEVSQQGTALLTRSIHPQDVQTIEVRTDEQDSKLKESLLTTRGYVVLDVQLKDAVDEDLFGRVEAHLGVQSTSKVGAYANGFKLQEHTRLHVFAESNRFGEQTIQLASIRNMGEEALQGMFATPANFKDASQVGGYEPETYNFTNFFARRDQHTLGISLGHDLNDEWSIYLGSYSNLTLSRYRSQNTQDFYFGDVNRFDAVQQSEEALSLNKLALRYDSETYRFSIGGNYIVRKIAAGEIVAEIYPSSIEDVYLKQNSVAHEGYLTLQAQTLLTSAVGLTLNSALIRSSHDNRTRLYDRSVTNFLSPLPTNGTGLTTQTATPQRESTTISLAASYSSKNIGLFEAGMGYESEAAINTTAASLVQYPAQPLILDRLTSADATIRTIKTSPYLRWEVTLPRVPVYLDNRVNYSILNYPNSTGRTLNSSSGLEYEIDARLDLGNFTNFQFNWQHHFTPLPFYDLLPGGSISNFQTITLPGDKNIGPTKETVVSFMGSLPISGRGWIVDASVLHGRDRTGYATQLSSDVIVREVDQLFARYAIFSVALERRVQGSGINFRLEPEHIRTVAENQLDRESPIIAYSRDYRIGLRASTEWEDSPLNLSITPKYIHIDYLTNFNQNRTTQQMVWLNANVRTDLLPDRLFCDFDLRQVYFPAARSQSLNSMLNLQLRYMHKNSSWHLDAGNLFDTDNFQRIDQSTVALNQTRHELFGRYIKLTYGFRFN
ncbi:hypothetical protein [Neolewinella maritima]|nr:hypothetical protein [Neolewinella maritima]